MTEISKEVIESANAYDIVFTVAFESYEGKWRYQADKMIDGKDYHYMRMFMPDEHSDRLQLYFLKDAVNKFIEVPYKPICKHKKMYASFILTSDPPQYPWICAKCYDEGTDYQKKLQLDPTYEDLLNDKKANG